MTGTGTRTRRACDTAFSASHNCMRDPIRPSRQLRNDTCDPRIHVASGGPGCRRVLLSAPMKRTTTGAGRQFTTRAAIR